MAMMSGAWLWAASAVFPPTRCSLSTGYAVISSVRLGSKRFLYSSAMNRWAATWNPTYCQKVRVVGALAFTRGALNSAGFLSSPTGAPGAAGCAPPICAAALLARGRIVATAAEASPRRSSPRRVSLRRVPSADSSHELLSVIVDLPGGILPSLCLRHPEDRRHLAELPPELAPGVAAVVAAIEIAIAAGGQDRIGSGGGHAHGPHCRVGLHGKSKALPRRARVPRAHHRS